MAFSVQVRQRCLRVEITRTQASYTLTEGEPIQIQHCGQTVTVRCGNVETRPLKPPTALPEPSQPPGRRPERPH
ncbi:MULTISPECIES: glycosyl hydrolase family 65 protein [Kitasatospora]|uniref:glycosyl hydrolase family 65 protein n=1 Tax=Kitasatospora TaxID=2063 RepID=UPI003CD0C08C